MSAGSRRACVKANGARMEISLAGRRCHSNHQRKTLRSRKRACLYSMVCPVGFLRSGKGTLTTYGLGRLSVAEEKGVTRRAEPPSWAPKNRKRTCSVAGPSGESLCGGGEKCLWLGRDPPVRKKI